MGNIWYAGYKAFCGGCCRKWADEMLCGEDDEKSVKADIPVQVEDKKFYVDSISDTPEQLTGDEESYFFHMSGFEHQAYT